MGDNLDIHRVSIPVSAFYAMPPERQSALLLLGMLLNDVNWLRKLLVEAWKGLADDGPEGDAGAGLMLLMATTLAGKIHEGWKRMSEDDLRSVFDSLEQPSRYKAHRDELGERLSSSKLLVRLRNNLAFHYPNKQIQFTKIKPRLGRNDLSFCVPSNGDHRDVFSRMSMLASMELIAAISPDSDYLKVLEQVWGELADVSELYSHVVFDLIAELTFDKKPQEYLRPQTLPFPAGPARGEQPVRFFSHWPSSFRPP